MTDGLGRMIDALWRWFVDSRLWIWVAVIVILLATAWSGYSGSLLLAILFVAGIGMVVLLQRPVLGLLALVFASSAVRWDVGTGSEVFLTLPTLLVPALLGLWLLKMMRQRMWNFVPSRTNRPLVLFLLAGLLSLLAGNVFWDPAVPRSGSFLIVQLGQWSIFAFSAGAFWLAGNLVRDEVWLRRLVFFFLVVGGIVLILAALPSTRTLVIHRLGYGMGQAPFLLLLAAVAGGQLLFNRQLAAGWRLFLLTVLGAEAVFVFFVFRDIVSYMVGVIAAAGALVWLRWPRLRWPVVILVLLLLATGLLTSAVYEFAGGEEEWLESGGSRLVLIRRVIEVSMRNPITGLGPAAYRRYAAMKPLAYEGALWIVPTVNSHNNYVDLFSQLGLLGLGLFFWFAVEVTRLGFRVRARYTTGFAAGYANAILAVWAGSLALMAFADWILPFVYNIGFRGFDASVLVWLFLGGLVALDSFGVYQL